MVRECFYTLPDGRRCPHPALREKYFCRHHQSFLEPPASAPAPNAATETSSRPHPGNSPDSGLDLPVWIQHWRELGVRIPGMNSREIDEAFSEILAALSDDTISHRCAGRFIQLIVRRTEALRSSRHAPTPSHSDAITP